MMIDFKIDYLSVTIFGDSKMISNLWRVYFEQRLGKLQKTKRQGRGYKTIALGMLEAKVYSHPHDEQEHFHIEIPGQALEAMGPEMIGKFYRWLITYREQGGNYRVTRIDLAYDHFPISVKTAYEKIYKGHVRTWAKRETLQYIVSPFQLQEDKKTVGCETCYLGSRSSSRYMRIYNLHGFVRLEIEFKQERAQKVADDILQGIPELWAKWGIQHVRDFIDFFETEEKEILYHPWDEFINNMPRRMMKTTPASKTCALKARSWMMEQWAPWYSVMVEVDPDFMERVKREGQKRLKPHHEAVLQSLSVE